MSTGLSVVGPESGSSAMSIATTRQAAETQAAMIVAKQFPRDETASIARIKRACGRVALAECSMYSYPKGGQQVTGPSIRLAEAMAQSWGNIDYGIIELSNKAGESQVMAYAWDLETNTRRQMVFSVPHIRQTKQGTTLLTDPRDVYELVANQGSRRVRACILGVIPGDVQDLAIAECEKTLKDGTGKPLADRIRDMVLAFADLGVTKEMIEERLQHPVTACTSQNVVNLGKIFQSVRDGISKREDWFNVTGATPAKDAGTEKKSRTSQAAAAMKKPEQAEETQPHKESDADGAVRAIMAAKTTDELIRVSAAVEKSGFTGDDKTAVEEAIERRSAELAKRSGGQKQ